MAIGREGNESVYSVMTAEVLGTLAVKSKDMARKLYIVGYVTEVNEGKRLRPIRFILR